MIPSHSGSIRVADVQPLFSRCKIRSSLAELDSDHVARTCEINNPKSSCVGRSKPIIIDKIPLGPQELKVESRIRVS